MKKINRLITMVICFLLFISVINVSPIKVEATIGENSNNVDLNEVNEFIASISGNEDHYVGRVKEMEDDLNTFVYLNADGTFTMKLFDHPVKYVDDSGNVKDIGFGFEQHINGSYSTKDNVVETVFSKDIKDGILLNYKDVALTLVPIIEEKKDLRNLVKVETTVLSSLKDEETVQYHYGKHTSLEYQLTYTGFKEDIVVSEYTGQTEYNFILKTNGLTLTKIDSSYFLVDDAGEIKATIGDIIIFTADERNNAFGEMTHTTVRDNQEYLMTIHIDAEYLKDEKTVYPIRIDPTIEVTTGTGAIQDVTLNSLRGSNGSSDVLTVGKRDTYGISRILMKFPGVNLSMIDLPSRITEAHIEIRDLMCESESLAVYCHPFMGNAWDESTATWSNVNPDYYHPQVSANTISYNNGTQQETSHRYKFDITSVVRGWKSGSYDINKGIMLKAYSTVENGSSYIKKTLGSYNRTSNKPSISITYSNGITLNQTSAELYEDETLQLSATSTPMTASYNWFVMDSQIASVDSNGKVTAKNPGTTVVVCQFIQSSTGLTNSTTCWITVKIPDGTYWLRNMDTQRLVDIEDPSSSEGAIIQQWDFNGDSQERWIITYLSNGYYNIKSEYSNKYIGVENSSNSSGAKIKQYSNGNSSNTRWKIETTLNGSYKIVPECSSYVLSVPTASNSNGTDLVQLTYTYDTNYRDEWEIVPFKYGAREYIQNNSGTQNCHSFALMLAEIDSEWHQNSNEYWINYGVDHNYSLPDVPIMFQLSYNEKVINDFLIWANASSPPKTSDNRDIYIDEDISYMNDRICEELDDNQYRIALRTGMHEVDGGVVRGDYHFWYQTYDGRWANKHGTTNSELLSKETTPYSDNTSGWSAGGYDGFYDSIIKIYIVTLEDN